MSKSRMIYHLGVDAGFFSEYRSMIDAVIFARRKNARFFLYSKDANFAFERGWSDYFEPFSEENDWDALARLNRRNPPSLRRILREDKSLVKWWLKARINFILAHILAFFRYGGRVYLNDSVKVDRDENYLKEFREIANETFRLNPETEKFVEELIRGLNLPEVYSGCQIRAGDKTMESSLLASSSYLDYINAHGLPKDVFVLTDDYRCFEELEGKGLALYTLCGKDERGYVNKDFINSSKEAKKAVISKLLANIVILQRAESFVGTITTNPCLFLLAIREKGNHLVDGNPSDIADYLERTMFELGAISKASTY